MQKVFGVRTLDVRVYRKAEVRHATISNKNVEEANEGRGGKTKDSGAVSGWFGCDVSSCHWWNTFVVDLMQGKKS